MNRALISLPDWSLAEIPAVNPKHLMLIAKYVLLHFLIPKDGSLVNFEKYSIDEVAKIEIRLFLTKINGKFSFSAIKLRIDTL